ncbi:rhomboid family intramembrane serine protease, partial [Halobacteriales archaeon QS_9_70_65]
MEIPGVVWRLLLLAGVAVSLAAIVAVARPGGRWGLVARRRLVLGVPWGTLLAAAGIVGFYLVVQNGLATPRDPVVIPFRAWGYFYPTGM